MEAKPDVFDIEDLDANHPLPSDRPRIHNLVPRVSKRSTQQRERTKVPVVGESYIPGTETIFVKTWGCGHNNSDGEYMAGLLAAYGYNITDVMAEADLWVLNSCAVKAPSEQAFHNMVAQGETAGKKLVLAGCVPSGQSNKGPKYSIVGVQQIDRVVEVVEQTLKGNTVKLMGQKKLAGKKLGGANLNLPKIRRNPLVEVLSISTGCLNQCTYCKTKHARGELGSYPPEDIVARVESVIQEGVIEIWITSEDTGAYGRDIGTNIVELLTAVLNVMPEGTMLRLGMTNPPYILEHVQGISKLLKHPRMYSYLHVPIQAASNEILYRMKREYTLEDFKSVVDRVRAENEGMTIATDIIAGFPGETEEDFQETMDLCEEYEFPCLYINQFFPRPGTPAALMEKVDTKVVKTRTKRLSTLFRSYFPHKDKLGKVYRVLTAEESTDKKFYVCHNKIYDQILIPKRPELMGRMFDVKIIEVGKFHMMGEVIDSSLASAPPRVQASTVTTVGKGLRSTVVKRRAHGKTGSSKGDDRSEVAETISAKDEESLGLLSTCPQTWFTPKTFLGIVFVLLSLDLLRVFWN